MKAVLKNNVSKFVLMVSVGSLLCSIAIYLVTLVIAANVNDVMFIVGLFLTIGSVFSMIEGRPTGAESIIHPESNFISSENIDVTKLENDKLLTSVYIIDKVKSKLLSTEFLTIGLIMIVISYIF